MDVVTKCSVIIGAIFILVSSISQAKSSTRITDMKVLVEMSGISIHYVVLPSLGSAVMTV